jgi:hypothetical protein
MGVIWAGCSPHGFTKQPLKLNHSSLFANSFGNLATASTEVQSWLEMFSVEL